MTTSRQELAFTFRRTVENLRSSLAGAGAAALVIFVIHLLAGLLLLAFLGAHGIAPALFPDGKVLAILDSGTSPERLTELADTMRSWAEVAEAVVVPGEESRARAEERLGRRKVILEGLGAGAFPPAIEISTRQATLSAEAHRQLNEKLRGIPDITRVVSSLDWTEQLGTLPDTLKTTGGWSLAVLATLAVLLVFLSVRQSIAIRRDETAISRTLGASAFFSTSPFYLEGTLIGVAGAFPAGLVLLIGAAVLGRVLPLPWAALAPWGPKEVAEAVLVVTFSGIFSGTLGSWLAVRLCDERHLPDAP